MQAQLISVDSFPDNMHEFDKCNCPSPCVRTIFEPSLSFSTLAESNIDQVALKTLARKNYVRERFLYAMETQQRVFTSIKESDSVTMKRLLTTTASLESSMNEIYSSGVNRRTFAETYQMVDILSNRFLPSQDATYALTRNSELKAIRASVNDFTFSTMRSEFKNLLDNVMQYNSLESEALKQIRHCISEGLNGMEDYGNICGQTQIIPCTFLTQLYCSLKNFSVIPDLVFSEKTEADLIAEAELKVSEIQEYNDIIKSMFTNGLDPLKYPEHYECQEVLNHYTETILPEFTEFLNLIASMKNVTSLGEAESLLSMLETLTDNSLGPFFLKEDSMSGWTIPTEDENVEKVCSWYIGSFDDEDEDALFDRSLQRYRDLLPQQQEAVSETFNEVVRLLSALHSSYNTNLKEPIRLFRSYLDEEITKKNLSGVIANPKITLAVINMETARGNMEEGIEEFENYYRSFIHNYEEFYATLDSRTWPFITNSNLRNYNFLGQMMQWYDHFNGKELLEKYPQLNDELNGHETFTGLNISKVIVYAVEGFPRNADAQAGFHAFIANIKDSVLDTVQSLRDQLEKIAVDLTAYQNKIVMDEKFYA